MAAIDRIIHHGEESDNFRNNVSKAEIVVSIAEPKKSGSDCDSLTVMVEQELRSEFHGKVDVLNKLVEVPVNVERSWQFWAECEFDNHRRNHASFWCASSVPDCLVGVGWKRTEKMIDGGTLEETKAILPCSEESVEELGEEDGAEKIDELNNGSSADVKVVESEIVDRAESADGSSESKIL